MGVDNRPAESVEQAAMKMASHPHASDVKMQLFIMLILKITVGHRHDLSLQ
jgi:hypothetical protein